jgi:clan AA aspartic protease
MGNNKAASKLTVYDDRMGFVRAELHVMNPAGRRNGEDITAIVDTGATLTKLPIDLLRRLGIKPYDKRKFRLADGRLVRLDVGNVLVKIQGHLVSAEVSFGRPGEQPLIGATFLESAGLAPDPVRRRLVPVDLLMM